MKGDVELLKGAKKHVPAIMELYRSVGWDKKCKPAVIERALKNSITWAAKVDGRIVGILRVVTDHATVAYIMDVLVNEEFRRPEYRFGSRLGQAAIDWCKASGFEKSRGELVLFTKPEAREKYKRMGFKDADNGMFYHFDWYEY